MIGATKELAARFVGDQDHQPAASGLFQIGRRLIEELVGGRHNDGISSSMRAMGQASSRRRHSLRCGCRRLVQLERTLHGDGEGRAATEEEDVPPLGDLPGDGD